VRNLTHLLLGMLLVSGTRVAGGESGSFPEIYNTQPETIPLLQPEEALKRMRLPPGFHATLFAGEPDVRQPIAMTFDARGRLWVAENYTYSEASINYDPKLRDRLLIFEDTNGDGHFDKQTVFWDQAERLTSIAVGFGGVFATCPPYLLFIPDRNGDDVPDGPPEILLDGFEYEKARHTVANGLKFGPDGWLYGRHGIQATSTVGKPGAPAEARIRLNACIWRYHPTRHVFELVTQGTTNPWGSDWDENGELFFINTVIGHLWHAQPGAYFKRMYGEPFDPYIYELIDQTADHFHWDTREGWSDIRKGTSSSTSAAGGGHAHSGLLIYQGDNWPAEYRNEFFMLNYHGKRINHDHVERQGAGYVGHHATDFMFMDDPWFRGIDLLSGPDGGVYVSDWSDIGECHDNDGVHRTSGRIYKITYRQPTNHFQGDLSKLDNTELVKLQTHPNEWFVRGARQVLQERASRGADMRAAHGALLKMFAGTQDASRKLRALWALYVTGGAKLEWVRAQLGASDEHLRVWAIRLLVDEQSPPADVVSQFTRMARQDRSGLVVAYLASALQRMPEEQRWPLALALCSRGEFSEDKVLPLMIWYGIEPAVGKTPDRAVELIQQSAIGKVRALAVRRIAASANDDARARTALGQVLASRDLNAPDVLQGMSAGFEGQVLVRAPEEWAKVKPQLVNGADEKVRLLAREVDARFGSDESKAALVAAVDDPHQEKSARRRCLDVLVQTKSAALERVLPKLINDPELGPAAMRGMAALDLPGSTELLLKKFTELSQTERQQAIQSLITRPASAAALVDAVQHGKVPKQEIDATAQRQLRSLPDPALQEKVNLLWPQSDTSPDATRQLFARYKKLLTQQNLSQADPSRGHTVFQQTCAICHRLYGEGAQIGPDLTGADRHNLDYLLENILTPSAIVPESYRVSMVSLKDERVLNGIIVSKTPDTVALQTPSEKLTLPMSEVESMRESQLSLMPEGLLDSLKEPQVLDLISYLMSSNPPSVTK
jgi:putative membrane-bound dehydrogenase-like protein